MFLIYVLLAVVLVVGGVAYTAARYEDHREDERN